MCTHARTHSDWWKRVFQSQAQNKPLSVSHTDLQAAGVPRCPSAAEGSGRSDRLWLEVRGSPESVPGPLYRPHGRRVLYGRVVFSRPPKPFPPPGCFYGASRPSSRCARCSHWDEVQFLGGLARCDGYEDRRTWGGQRAHTHTHTHTHTLKFIMYL